MILIETRYKTVQVIVVFLTWFEDQHFLKVNKIFFRWQKALKLSNSKSCFDSKYSPTWQANQFVQRKIPLLNVQCYIHIAYWSYPYLVTFGFSLAKPQLSRRVFILNTRTGFLKERIAIIVSKILTISRASRWLEGIHTGFVIDMNM